MSETPKSPSMWSKRYDAKEIARGVSYLDVTPAAQSDDVPMLYAPGWATDAQTLRPIVAAMNDEGRRGIAMCAPHGTDTDKYEDLTGAEARKVAAMEKVFEDAHAEKVDAVGLSEAGVYLTATAVKHPGKFRSLTLVCPSGMIEKDTSLGVTIRCVTDSVVSMAKELFKPAFGKSKPGDSQRLGNMLRLLAKQHPIVAPNASHSISEVQAMGNTVVLDRLKELRAKGVKINIIVTTDDMTFPARRMGLTNEHYDSFIRMPGMHNEIVMDPKPFMHAAVAALEKETRGNGNNAAA